MGADQARAALTAAAPSGHGGGGSGLVDEDEPGRIKPALARAPPPTRGVHLRAHLFRGVGGFLKPMPRRSKKRQIAEIDAGVPCLPSRSPISAKVRSGVSATSCSSQSPVPLKRRRAPITTLGSRRHRSALSPGLCQLDHKARTDREHGSHSAHAAARLNLPNHPLAKVYRIGSRHPLSPNEGIFSPTSTTTLLENSNN
jgi:hypothetical protein